MGGGRRPSVGRFLVAIALKQFLLVFVGKLLQPLSFTKRGSFKAWLARTKIGYFCGAKLGKLDEPAFS